MAGVPRPAGRDILELLTENPIPTMPVETPEFSAKPWPYLEAARREHPWLARFSLGYIVHGYQACCDLLADDENPVDAEIVEAIRLHNLEAHPGSARTTPLQHALAAGDKVNLECDMIGKYVVRAMELRTQS